jgi:hypothetical protein
MTHFEHLTHFRTLRGRIACACLCWASTSSADVVTDWNEVTTELIKTRPIACWPQLQRHQHVRSFQ